MSEVAEMAGISIGSLYQYFPDNSAIIQTLARRYNAEGRKCIEAELFSVRDIDGFREAFGRLIDIYYGIFLEEPSSETSGLRPKLTRLWRSSK